MNYYKVILFLSPSKLVPCFCARKKLFCHVIVFTKENIDSRQFSTLIYMSTNIPNKWNN